MKPKKKEERLNRRNPKARQRKNKRRHGYSMKKAVAAQHELNVLWIRQQALEAEMAEASFRLEAERGKRPRMYVV